MSSTTRTGKEIDIEKKLQQYGIEIETEELPKELKQFIDNCIFAPPQLTTSPAAKKLRDDQPWAMSLNEASGKALLAPNLLFVGESMPGGIKGIKTQADVALYKRFLPQAPETLVEESFGPLAEPQPDTVVGYIPYGEAKKLGVTSFFTREEETVFLPETLHHDIYFPFLTCQWKSYKGSEGHAQAVLQGARDGATIVNYMDGYFSQSGRTRSVVDTHHWSLTCDMNTAKLFCHWLQISNAGERTFHMKLVDEALLRNPKDTENAGMADFRRILRNILDYAIGDRRQMIKDAIPGLKDTLALRKRKRPSKAGSTNSKSTPPPAYDGYNGR